MANPKLLYMYDPLCGWCYGFSPAIKKIWELYGDRLHCEVWSGGLAIGEAAQPIGTGWAFIGRSLHIVEETTGVHFGEGFKALVQEGTYVYNSEPPCIAMTVFKEYHPARAVAFAHDLQHALFYDGHSLNTPSTYRELVQPYGIDADEFISKMNDASYRTATYKEFETVASMGVSGFPTLVYLDSEFGVPLARGYRPYDAIVSVLDKMLDGGMQR